MADEVIKAEGAEPEVDQIEANEQQDAATETQKQTIDMDAVNKMLEERDKKWQSRFDKILAEKKAEETKAMTVEDRIKQLEEERQRERLDWSRKEAKAQAQIDDDLEAAILAYSSTDPERIAEGARGIREMFDKTIAEYKARIEELEKNQRFSSGPIKGGGKSQQGLSNMSFDELMAYAAQGDAEQAEVMAFQKQYKK